MASPGRGFKSEGLGPIPAATAPSISDLRLIVSGLRIGVTLSLWQERLLDESRGRVFRPIRARKHHESKKKERRDRRRASATPKPPAFYKMKDFYLPGYQPPDFPGKMGSSPPREFDSTGAEDDRASEGSPEHQDTILHIAKDSQPPSRDILESPFRMSRDRTRKFLDSFVAEARAIWKRTWHSLQEESLSEDESGSGIENVFLSLTLEMCLDGGLKALDTIFQGQALNSLDDVYLIIFVSTTLASVSRTHRLIGEYSSPGDSDLKQWQSGIGPREWSDFCKTLGLLYGSSDPSSSPEYGTAQVSQRPLRETLESTSMYKILVKSLQGTESLGEAFLCLSNRKDVGNGAAASPVNPAFQIFLETSRKTFAQTVKTAISEDFSGKLLFLEALSTPAVGLIASGTLPTLRAFENYVLGLARIYISDFGDFKLFVRRFLRFCEGRSTKVLEIFVKSPQNEEGYSREYCTQKTEAEVNWYRVNVGRSITGSLGSSMDFDQNADQGDTSRPKYSSQFRRNYTDVGNLLALPELLWTSEGNIKLEVDDDDDGPPSPMKPAAPNPPAAVAPTAVDHAPTSSTDITGPPPQSCFQGPEEPPAFEVDDDDNEDGEVKIEDLIAKSAGRFGSRCDLSSNLIDEFKPDVIMEAAPAVQSASDTVASKPQSKRKSWRTDSIVSDIVSKKRKGLQIVCDICGMTLSLNPAGTSKSNLIRHNATHAKNIVFKCTFPGCDKSFGRKDNLTRHMRKVHDNNNINSNQ